MNMYFLFFAHRYYYAIPKILCAYCSACRIEVDILCIEGLWQKKKFENAHIDIGFEFKL